MKSADQRRHLLRYARLLAARASVVAIATVALAGSVSAATFNDLYGIIVPMGGPGAPEGRARTQDETVRLAMAQLLTRVTGRRDAAFEPALAGMLQNARDFLEQVGPLDRDNVIVRFNANNVEAELVRLEQPVWGSERPLTLLWIAVDAGLGQRELLAAEPRLATTDTELGTALADLRAEIAAVASERGLLIALPLVDIEDMAALSFADVWGGFRDRIERASERYAADDVLVGQVRLTDYGAAGRWTLLKDQREIGLPAQAAREALDALADVYAAEFATIGRASATAITVLGVESLEDYGRVMRYLESLSVLESVVPEELAGGALRIRVAARGGESALRRVLGLGEVLRPAAAGTDPLTFTLSR